MIDYSNPLYGVDIKGGVAMLAGNSKIYLKLLNTYASGDLYEKFLEALRAGDIEATRVAAHTLKGAAGNLHLQDLFEKIKSIEGNMKESHDMPGEAELDELEQIHDLTLHTIRNLLANPALIDENK